MIQFDQIAQAAEAIDPVFLNTPQYRSEALSQQLGVNVIHKVETCNPIGSFKGRGVDWWFQKNADETHIVCASAGNFGQAVAYVGRKYEAEVTVFASENANAAKVAAMQRLGAHVPRIGHDFDAAKLAAAEYAQQMGAYLLVDGLAPEIAEGAGSIMVELARLTPLLDKFYVPIGNGSLINGIATYVKEAGLPTEIVGVVAENAPAMMLSWQQGSIINTETADTIADGIAVRLPIDEAVVHMRSVVDEIISVSEDEIAAAVTLMLEQEQIVSEPAGAVSLAAIVKKAKNDQGMTVGNLVCGKNISGKLLLQSGVG